MTSTTEHNKRKIRAPERYREDGTYFKGPKEPKEYFNNYYHTILAQEETCRCCNEVVKKSYMYKHQKTRKCRIHFEQMPATLQMLSDAIDQLPELSDDLPIHFGDVDHIMYFSLFLCV
jgi:hypothetical protein